VIKRRSYGIGDRYDRFFFLVSQVQTAIRSGLARKEDVRISAQLVRREATLRKSAEYFESLDAWQRCVPG
jgi:hypothetical protein